MGKPRPMRASAQRHRADDDEIRDPELEDNADEIRHPKPVKLKLKSGELEIHELSARAQRSFAGLALRITGEARTSGGHFVSEVAGLLASPRYCVQFIPFIVAALQPADKIPAEEQFRKLSEELDDRFASPMGAVDLAKVFTHMCERYDIPLVIGALPAL